MKWFISGLILFLTIGLFAQQSSASQNNVNPLFEEDEDDFASSLQTQKGKVIILDQETKKPQSYEVPIQKSMVVIESEITEDVQGMGPYLLPEDFTGYKIQLLRMDGTPLAEDDLIFFIHGWVVEEQLTDGSYAYLVGEFDDEDMANAFLQKQLIQNYPDAVVVYFEKGKRQ